MKNLAVLASVCLPSVTARFLGPLDPAPVDLTSSDSAVRKAWDNLTATFAGHFGGGAPVPAFAGLANVTFSTGLFSIHDAAAAAQLQYHRTAPEVRASPHGVTRVDGDSIYRVASVSKLFTVLAGLLELRTADWHRPLTDIFPELAGQNDEDDPIDHAQWAQITPWALANQISGIQRDPWWGGADLLYALAAANVTPAARGLPDLDPATLGVPAACRSYTNCTVAGFVSGLRKPNFLPWQTPGYADNNFILLGMAISRLTGADPEAWFQRSVLGPLNMTRTTSITPTAQDGDGDGDGDGNGNGTAAASFPGYVVVAPVSGFAVQGGVTAPSGGIFSTTNDLARLGVGVLGHALLPGAATRAWMKPTAGPTAHARYAVGAPWEIYRWGGGDGDGDDGDGAPVDLYTKLGSSGSYSAYQVLIPAFGAGFSVLSAAGDASQNLGVRAVADAVSEALLPALRAQAAAEARRNFAGTYVSPAAAGDGVDDGNGNVTMVLRYNATAGTGFGLSVARFTAGDYDTAGLVALPGEGEDTAAQQLVLQPAIPSEAYTASNGRGGRLAFQATPVVIPGAGDRAPGLFSRQFEENSDWFQNNPTTYGGEGLGTYIFDVGGDGRATAVEVPFLRRTLVKVAEEEEEG
ncbi:beta-lactamase/transpeptidase-like protein [Xylariomycetidae sp. FL0641]|nr:beta-lactamase/transpeptidase-like protein [Xylariomycetidae sp. FL0641]